MMTPHILGKSDNPEELADLIDKLMAQGSGHVNIASDADGEGLKVDTVNSTDCGAKGACMQPTETSVDPDDED
ncbi:MAG: hypothetical protein K2K14_08200 [Ruminococcus sp.]|nr:hypothetical protein [Ruminococcus sp.]